MSLPLTLPQARIPLGWAMVQGQRVAVEIDMEWMLVFLRLMERTGGTTGDTNFIQYINQLFEAPLIDPGLQDAVRAIDELRNELSSARNETQTLRAMIEELSSSIAESHSTDLLRNRIESIEDRLA
jgi:hypothetical protein